MVRETFFCRSSKAPAQPTKKSHSNGWPDEARGRSRSAHHSVRRLEPMPQGFPCVSIPLKTRCASSGKPASTSTCCRRMSTSRAMFSMRTGQAVSHQPQVVQAQAVSGGTTAVMAGSFAAAASRAAGSRARASATRSGACSAR